MSFWDFPRGSVIGPRHAHMVRRRLWPVLPLSTGHGRNCGSRSSDFEAILARGRSWSVAGCDLDGIIIARHTKEGHWRRLLPSNSKLTSPTANRPRSGAARLNLRLSGVSLDMGVPMSPSPPCERTYAVLSSGLLDSDRSEE